MNYHVIISTEFDGKHQDWHSRDDWEDLLNYLELLDEVVEPAFNDGRGPFLRQITDLIEWLTGPKGRTHGSLVLAVDETRDLTVDAKRVEEEEDEA